MCGCDGRTKCEVHRYEARQVAGSQAPQSDDQITIDRAKTRQRVAKFLFPSERDSPWAEREWDMPQHCNQAPWLRRADKLLTVAAGEEG